jgi:predicted O-methyltransferase YrrM
MNEHDLTKGRNPFLGDKDELWTARDEQSSEDELQDFLYGLIRLIKPNFIVETGAYLGDATIAMARALRDNKYGTILACETDEKRVAIVDGRIKEQGLDQIAQVILKDGKSTIEACGNSIDFAFIDSSPNGDDRKAEIDALIPFLKPRQMFALHDTAPQHEKIHKIANEVALPKVYFNTPRGLMLFMKQ